VSRQSITRALEVFSLACLLAGSAWAQQPMASLDRDRAQGMLKVVGDEVRKHYYDPNFHGLKWEARIEEANQKIGNANSFGMALSYIAGALDALNDSHTFFLPPQHGVRVDYGFQFQIIGEQCFVTRVRPKSDADTKGVKSGDQILSINGYDVNRDDLWKMQYVFSVLRPQPQLHLELQDLTGSRHAIDALAKVHQQKLVTDLTGPELWDVFRQWEEDDNHMRPRYLDIGDQLLVIRLPGFFGFQDDVGGMISRASKYQNLILDLRGNPGGSIETLKFLLGGIFDKEIKIGDRVGRKEKKPEMSKAMHNHFTGKLVVIINSNSASAAEIFARIVQLEKRGVVIGDRSSGSVMEARHYNEQMGSGDGTYIFYGVSVTESDLIMSDGKSLEHVGVVPDEIVLPSANDLAAGRDPVLSHAAELLGTKITPEDAGKAFPYEWPAE